MPRRLLTFTDSPYTLSAYVGWWVYWIYRLDIRKEQYTHEDLVYLICKNMRCSRDYFDVRAPLLLLLLLLPVNSLHLYFSS